MMSNKPQPTPPKKGCNLPPRGWYCSLKKGHNGPCPTSPVEPTDIALTALSDQLQAVCQNSTFAIAGFVVFTMYGTVEIRSSISKTELKPRFERVARTL